MLADLAPKVADALGKVPAVTDVNSGVVPAGDALEIHVDRVKASLEGVDPQAITADLETMLSGRVMTQVQNGPKMMDVRVWVPRNYFKSSDDLAQMNLRARTGIFFPSSEWRLSPSSAASRKSPAMI